MVGFRPQNSGSEKTSGRRCPSPGLQLTVSGRLSWSYVAPRSQNLARPISHHLGKQIDTPCGGQPLRSLRTLLGELTTRPAPRARKFTAKRLTGPHQPSPSLSRKIKAATPRRRRRPRVAPHPAQRAHHAAGASRARKFTASWLTGAMSAGTYALPSASPQGACGKRTKAHIKIA